MKPAHKPKTNVTLNKAAARVRNTFVTDDSRWERYWGSTYTTFFWLRMFVLLVMVAAPAAFLALGLQVLFGYLWFLVIPWGIARYNKNTTHNEVIGYAYDILLKLKDGWAEHGKVFYRQIWEHDCDHHSHGHYSQCYQGKCQRVTNCDYCDARIQEMSLLLDSQRSVEAKASVEVDNTILELSQQFRENVAIELEGRSPETNLMKEISASVRSK